MKQSVLLRSKNRLLIQKLKLMLRNVATVEVSESADPVGYDRVILDLDTVKDAGCDAIRISSNGDGDFTPPIDRAAFLALFTDSEKRRRLTVREDVRCAVLGDKVIKLTEVEYRLLKLMLSEKGYVSRATILEQIWGDEADSGVINVYVHYLREKLEKDSEKIIISSRKNGYTISEKFR